jgi:hypothetical protein
MPQGCVRKSGVSQSHRVRHLLIVYTHSTTSGHVLAQSVLVHSAYHVAHGRPTLSQTLCFVHRRHRRHAIASAGG